MKKLAVIGFLLLTGVFAFAQFSDMNKDEKVDVTAGIWIHQWEIKRTILEISNNVVPVIIKGSNTLRADKIIYDHEKEIGYAYGNVFFENKKEGMILTAGEGTYYSKKKQIVVKDKPFIKMTSSGTTARSDEMYIYTERNYVILVGNVEIVNEKSIIRGNRATYYTKSGQFYVSGKAEAVQEDTLLQAEKLNLTTRNGKLENYTANGNVYLENKKEGYTVHTGMLEYYKDLGYTRLTEEPVVFMESKKDSNTNILSADKIDMNSKDGQVQSYTAAGNVQIEDKKQGYTISSGKLEYYKDRGYTRITDHPVITHRNKGMKTYANKMEKYDKDNKAVLSGNVVIVMGTKRAYSKWAEYFIEKKKMYMTGNPILQEGVSRFKGQRIEVDVGTETMHMIGGGTGFYEYRLQ